MSTKSIAKTPVFIVSGKSPIHSYGGGYSTYALNLAKILSDLGYKVYIICAGDKNEEQNFTFGTIVLFKVSLFRILITALPGLPIYSYIFSRGIRKIAMREKAEKIIVWGIGPWGLAGTFLKKKTDVKMTFIDSYFTTIQHEWRRGLKAVSVKDYGIFLTCKFFLIYYTIVQLLSFFDKKVLESADIIATNYKSTEDILQDEFQIPNSRFRRTSFSVRLYKRQAKTNITEKDYNLPKNYVLFLSRHDPRKGVNFLLHAIKILIEKNIHIPFVIAGAGEMYEANKKLAKKLGIEKYVIFLGFVNDSKKIMENASIFCFPTVEEGAGALIINEAMSLGLPIISTACDGIVEDIENGKSGILVPAFDSPSLANEISNLYRNKTLARELGENARKSYLKRFSYENMKKDIGVLLEEV